MECGGQGSVLSRRGGAAEGGGFNNIRVWYLNNRFLRLLFYSIFLTTKSGSDLKL